jgi:hypothetical protein
MLLDSRDLERHTLVMTFIGRTLAAFAVLTLCAVGCGPKSGSTSSGAGHQSLQAGSVYHLVIRPRGSAGSLRDDEWIDPSRMRWRISQRNDRYQQTAVFDGRSGISQLHVIGDAKPYDPDYVIRWHSLHGHSLPPDGIAMPLVLILESAIRGDSTVEGRRLEVVHVGRQYEIRLGDHDEPDLVIDVANTITPLKADKRHLFDVPSMTAQEDVTELVVGVRPETATPAYWLGSIWDGHSASRAALTNFSPGETRLGQFSYTVDYGSATPDYGSATGRSRGVLQPPIAVTTGGGDFPGGFIGDGPGRDIRLADGTLARLQLPTEVPSTTTPLTDSPSTPSRRGGVRFFTVLTSSAMIDVTGLFDEAEIPRIARALRPL